VADRVPGFPLPLVDLARALKVGRGAVHQAGDGDGEQVAGQRLLAVLGFRHVRAAVRVGEVQQALCGIGVEPLGALVEVDPARGPVSRVSEPALDVHPPRLAGLRVGAHQQYRLLRAHPVGDVGRLADEVKGPVVLPGEPAVAGLALDEDEPVDDLAGDRVAQLDLPVDPGVGLPLVPDEPHLVDLLVDQRDPAVTGLRADVDLL